MSFRCDVMGIVLLVVFFLPESAPPRQIVNKLFQTFFDRFNS